MSLPVRPGSCSNLWHDAFQGKSQAACVLTLLLNSVWLCTFVWWWNSFFFFSAFFGSVTRLYGLLCPIMEWWPSDIVLGYIFLKCESICVLLLVKKGKTFLLFFLIYFRFVTMKKNKQISNGMAVKQWQSDSLIQLVILLNGNNKIYHDAFCFYLFTYRLVFLCDVWRLSDAFPCHIYLCLETDERGEGWGLERGIIEVFASVYVCVWVSLSLLSITPITASHFILVTTLSRSLARSLTFFSLSPYLSHPLQLWKYNSSQPNFPFTLLSLYTPAKPLLSCLCLYSSLGFGVVRLDAEEEENLSGGAQMGGAFELHRKNACGTGFRIFHWNPDVCASFIWRKFASNAHAVQ